MNELQTTEAVLAGPTIRMSKERHEFDWTSDSWTLKKEVTIEVDEVLWLLEPTLQDSYRRVLRFHAENYSADYCRNIHLMVRKYLEKTEARKFSTTPLKNYLSTLDKDKEWHLGYIRAFLLRWYDQGYPGVADEAAQWLKERRLKGNTKGRAILSMDPNDGPFDDQELIDILHTAAQQYESGRIDLVTATFTMLLALTGRRPSQLRLLRIGDLMQSATTEGQRIDIVRIPRAKQRGQAPRSEFKNFWVTPEVWLLLTAQREAVIERARAQLGPLPGSITSELPLFPDWEQLAEIESVDELRGGLINDALHQQIHKFAAGLKKIHVMSDRTGKRVHITPRRFRYTLGSRAAREGHGAMVIAELLDHSDIQNAQIYTRDHPNFRQVIDDAVGKQLAPVAAAYAPRVVDSEREARNGHEPAMRVGTRTVKVGTCGSVGPCRAGILPCYTCIHFQAWVDAPHEKMLDAMLEEQQWLRESGASEMVIRATDANIRGVHAVIAACNARKVELGEARHG